MSSTLNHNKKHKLGIAVLLSCWIVQSAWSAPVKINYNAPNLARSSGVKYVYLDKSYQPCSAELFNDAGLTFLNDGKSGTKESAVVKWGNGFEKRMIVRFEFPAPVNADAVRVGWSWTQGRPKQWIDKIIVYRGNTPEERRKSAELEVGDVKNDHNVFLDLPFDKAQEARFITVEIIQFAHAQHYFFGIGEIIILGDRASAAKIEKYAAPAADQLTVGHRAPANIYRTGEAVQIPLELAQCEAGNAKIEWQFVNYYGEVTDAGSRTFRSRQGKNTFSVEVPPLPAGYYNFHCSVAVESDATHGISKSSARTTLIVAPEISRSAADAFAAGCKLGIQTGYINEECQDAFDFLGLAWRRNLLFFAPDAGKDAAAPNWEKLDKKMEKLSRTPRLYMFEIKTVPSFLRRSGDRTDDWFLRMPADLAAYEEFIFQQISRVPGQYRHFELWNEPWGHYTGPEFAELTKAMRRAIKRAKPDALCGPNLGPLTHLAEYIDAGGMEGMDFLTIHPYSPDFCSSPEKTELQEVIRDYRKLLKSKLGRDVPLYVTEIGWPTTPEGPTANTEEQQAAYMVRAALILLAEGVQGIMPYSAWQPETKRNNMESHFGFIRKNMTPKPVLAAYAAANRILEGAQFETRLKYGSDIGAFLFRDSSGGRVLALYANGKKCPFFFNTFAENVTVSDMFGNSRSVSTPYGRCSLELDDNVVYISGVGSGITGQAGEIEWSDVYKRRTRKALRLKGDPGDAASWNGIPSERICSKAVAPEHSSADFQTAYDDQALYIRVKVTDEHPGKTRFADMDAWRGDALEVFFSSAPEKMIPGFMQQTDFHILVTPFGKSGKPVGICADEAHKNRPAPGYSAEFKAGENGWEVLMRFSFDALQFKPQSGKKLALELALNDICPGHGRVQTASNQRGDNNVNSSLWSFLELAE